MECQTCGKNKQLNLRNFLKFDSKYYLQECKLCFKKSGQIPKIKPKVTKPYVKRSKPAIILCRLCNQSLPTKNLLDNSLCKLCYDKVFIPKQKCNICEYKEAFIYDAKYHFYKPICKECRHAYRIVQPILTKYKIQFSDYMALRKAQQGKCKICDMPAKSLLVDHSHESGKVRALLCRKCNMYIGFIECSIKAGLLVKSIEYIEEHYYNPQS